MRSINKFLWLGLTCALAACSDERPPPEISSARQTIVLDEQLVFVDSTLKQAFLLDLSQERPKSETGRYELPPRASSTVRRNGDHNEALILCAGERELEGAEAAPAALVVIAGDGETREYVLGTTSFNTLTQSEDGRYAIAYRSGETPGRTLDNPNELVVVDLDRAPDDEGAITGKTPAGLAHTLTRVLVSPTMRIADEDRRLLVLLSAAEVTVFDLNHLDRRATIVQLDERRNIDPVQVLFSNDQPTLYVRASSSDNIFMFRFEPYLNDEEGNDFQPAINPLSAGGQPHDMALFGSGTAERLLVVAYQQALVIDPATSKTLPVTLRAAADRVLVFSGRSPQDENEQLRALLYSTTESSMTFFDLEATGDAPSDSVELVTSEQPVQRLIPLVDGEEKSVVLLQDRMVTIVDLQTRTLTPFSTSTNISDALFDPVRKKLWVGPAGEPYVQSLELTTGRTGAELRLDAPITSFLPMFQRDSLLVLHSENLGYLTLVDAERPDRESSLSLRGYFVNQLFDRSDL
jgi:hypothetical protein